MMNESQAQGVFESNTADGDWDTAGSWTLISGSDADGIPDSDDDVTILTGDQINVQPSGTTTIDDLTITGTLNYPGNNRTVNVSGNLTMSGTSAVTGNNNARVLDVTGSFTVSSGATATINGQRLTIAGTTTLDGTLAFASTTGNKTFGTIDVNGTGHWNNNSGEDFVINGNIINDGTWTGCSANGCLYDMTSATGTVSGSATVTVADLNIDAPASITNNGTLQLTDDLTGSGTLTNGATGDFQISRNGPYSLTTIDFSTSGNTVTYNGGSNVTPINTTYHHLVVNKNITNRVNWSFSNTINGNVTITAGELRNTGTVNITGNLAVQGGEYSSTNTAAVTNVTGNFTMSSGTIDINDGDINIVGDLAITGGAMTVNQSSATTTIDVDDFTVATGTVTLSEGELNVNNVAGGLTVSSGTFTLAGMAVVVANDYNLDGGLNDLNSGSLTAATLDIAGSQTMNLGGASITISGATAVNGTLTIDGNNGIKAFDDITVNSGGVWNNITSEDFTISGNIVSNGASWTGCSANGCDYTLTSNSGTISGSTAVDMSDILITSPTSYTNQTTLAVTDRITGTGTFINGANASLTYSGNNSAGANFDITNFTASAIGNTVTYGRAGDQQLRTTTDADNNYHNLVINSTAAGNDLTLAGDITINNQLTMTLGDLFLSTNRLTLEDGATVSGGNANSYIGINSTGVLRQNYSAAGGTLGFPIGDANDFSPITAFTINAATFGGGAYLEFDITDADHPNRNTANTPTGDDDGTAATAFISRYWTVTANNITSPNYNVSYQYVDLDVTGTESDMVGAVYRIQPTLGILDWFERGTVSTASNTVTLTGADAFGDLYAMDNTLERLPIVLISFDAEWVNGQVVLNWVTSSEESNAFFTIERSSSGLDFERVFTRKGAGDSDALIHYSATDIDPPSGRVYYRLKQTDFNGTFAYSEVISVMVGEGHSTLNFDILGNQVRTGAELTIKRNMMGEGQFVLQPMDGSKPFMVPFGKQEGLRFSFQLPTEASRGLYVLQLIQCGQRVSQKLIIQ